ncbi:MAG TPA: hypothetical protein VFN71_12635 [Methylomirabilota bacterium]|nr:hypothetical protein [Methylomirabilota bacterium]
MAPSRLGSAALGLAAAGLALSVTIVPADPQAAVAVHACPVPGLQGL